MIRVIAGKHGGARLSVPGSGTRPTAERVREAVFSTLTSAGLTDSVRVADLCAGSGALGLEAYSRGARRVDLVDSRRAASRACQDNARRLGAGEAVRVHTMEALTFLRSGARAGSYDIIFLDPPYAQTERIVVGALEQIAAGEIVEPDGLVVIEHACGIELSLPAPFTAWRTRRYGDSAIIYAELGAGAPTGADD
ncbi:MAG: 16S rRNA (guanine(966)-N(2))-methyltransferase RsmD [Bowdeniella nasicola]|nr:16S rRNA (guanine(966)-N(2))-methyltransferase RsmD [Bowdeniella nasicola]